MKKIFVLLLFLFFVLSVNAYEYIIYNDPREGEGVEESNAKQYLIVDPNGSMRILLRRFNGLESYLSNFYLQFSRIKYSLLANYVSNEEFKSYYENDLVFLNDLYIQQPNPFLNYLYNDNVFSQLDYIEYSDYELLYNADGLAVESIVNGVWAGLYDDAQKGVSGRLYSRNGDLIYINGVEIARASMFDVINELLIVSILEVFGVASRSACYAIVAIVVIVLGALIGCVYLVSEPIRRRGGWVATFDENGKRVSNWSWHDPSRYNTRTNGWRRSFSDYRDYREYESSLSNGTGKMRKRRMF